MHEYSIVSALLDRVDDAARQHGATAVHRIRVQIGELSGVETGLLQEAFSLVRADTVSADAELEITAIEAQWRCGACDRVVARGQRLSCPECRSPARLARGAEIMLERVEMEVP